MFVAAVVSKSGHSQLPMASCNNSEGETAPGMAMLSLVSSGNLGLERGPENRALGVLMSEKHVKNNVVKIVLKEAWARFGPVKIAEVNDTTLVFDFASSKDRDQIIDLSPWSIHGHCLNVKSCPVDKSIAEIDFSRVQMWVQIHGLSLEMINKPNAQRTGDSIGRCLRTEDHNVMQQRTFLRVQVDVDTLSPLMSRFKWVDSNGNEKLASVRYERLTDFCYRCGIVGHSSNSCSDPVITDMVNGSPLYGPWTSCDRPKMNNRWVSVGGGARLATSRDPRFKSWREVMQEQGAKAQQGSYCKGNTNAYQLVGSARRSYGDQHSQAASNHSHHAPVVQNRDPVVQSRSGGLHSESNPSQPPHPNIEIEQQQLGSRQSEYTQVQVERIESQEEGHQKVADIARAADVLSVDTLETRVFDLNADPRGDTEIHVFTPCDLSLKLSTPTLVDQLKKGGEVLPSVHQQ